MGDFYYRRNADKALGGMLGLTLEERGAYNTILDLIYSRRNRLFNDDDDLRKWLACDVRVWKRIKASLIAKEKIYIDGEFIRNKTADDELKSRGYKNDTQAYPQNNPQDDLFAQNDPVSEKMSGTSGELPANLGAQVPRTYSPKSEGESIKNNVVTRNPVRARELIVSNISKPLTPFSEEPAISDLSDFNNLFCFACWLLEIRQLPLSEQQVLCDWIEKGYDLNRLRSDIKLKCQKFREKNGGSAPKTLSYFSPMLNEKNWKLPKGASP